MKSPFAAFVSLALPLALLSCHREPAKSLTVFCAANLNKAVSAIAVQYRAETGVEVRVQPGPTGTLLSQIQIAKQGDLFIAADADSLKIAQSKNLVREVLPLVVQHPVVAVAKGNPMAVKTMDDLLKGDVKLSLPDPGSSSIGKVSKKLLGARWDSLAAKAVVMKSAVTEVATDVQLHTVDAAIVWDSTVAQFAELEAVIVPGLSEHSEDASASILSACTQPQEALKFARYLAADDRGGKIFESQGFSRAGGDNWVAKPEMILFSGGVNRLAIEKLLRQFEEREGVTITTVFNGCGILCGMMKTMGDSSHPKFPDAYYACDVCFVPPVAQYFPEAVLLTQTEIGIAVPKGNPKEIRTLADLARPGLRIGLSNAEQATLGHMTAAILKSMNIYDSVMKNVLSQQPTADVLVNQMQVGSLDAIVVYKVNVQPLADKFDFLPLPADKAKAVQPFAVRGDSANRELSKRLLAFLRQNRTSFEQAGFVWTGDGAIVPSDKLDIPEWLKQK